MFQGWECVKGRIACPDSSVSSGLYHILEVNYLFCKLGRSVLFQVTVKAFLKALETLLF